MNKQAPVSEEKLVDRVKRSFSQHQTTLTYVMQRIQTLERHLKVQSKLEDRIKELERVIATHKSAIDERNRAVEVANNALHMARLENVKAKRENTQLKAKLRQLAGDIE